VWSGHVSRWWRELVRFWMIQIGSTPKSLEGWGTVRIRAFGRYLGGGR